MPIIKLSLEIRAPIERVFDLSRSIDLHILSTAKTSERAIAGVTSGLIGLNEEVTWRAKHFGVGQELTSRITQYERPTHFRDSMVKGAFRKFDHDHFFEARGELTQMTDVFVFEAPFGVAGRVASALFLTSYMKHFLKLRNEVIKKTAESDQWKMFLD